MKYISILLLSVLMCSPVCAMVDVREKRKEGEGEVAEILAEGLAKAVKTAAVVPVLAAYGVGYGAWCGMKLVGRGAYGAGSYLFGGNSDNDDTEVVGCSGLPGGSGFPRRPRDWRNDDIFGETRSPRRRLTLRQRQQMRKTSEENAKGFAGFIAGLFGYDKPDIDIDK